MQFIEKSTIDFLEHIGMRVLVIFNEGTCDFLKNTSTLRLELELISRLQPNEQHFNAYTTPMVRRTITLSVDMHKREVRSI